MRYLILFACAAITTELHAQSNNKAVFTKINKEVLANSKAYETLSDASKTIGHRLTGSENGKKAEQYAYDLLKSYGYNTVRFQPFEVESWSRGTVSLQLTDPATKTSAILNVLLWRTLPLK